MKESHIKLLEQFNKIADDGLLGNDIPEAKAEYENLPNGVPIMLKVASDFFKESEEIDPELSNIRHLMCQLMIVAYRESKRKNPEVAEHFLNSFIQDYPGVQESCLLPRWVSLTSSCLAVREVAHSGNRLIIWQQSIKQIQAYNEFLNALFGYFIILWRVHLDKPINPNVLNTSYGNKKNQLRELTGGDDGAFYFFLRIAQPDIRNSIAHEQIWVDQDSSIVHYIHGNQDKVESELPLADFMSYSLYGSHIPHSYLAAISIIAVMEFGTEYAQSLLPVIYRNVFNHPADAE